MTSVNNGMTPAQVTTAVNSNLINHQTAFEIDIADILVAGGSFVNELISNFDNLEAICGVTLAPISFGMSGLAFRSAVNSNFTTLENSATFQTYYNYFSTYDPFSSTLGNWGFSYYPLKPVIKYEVGHVKSL